MQPTFQFINYYRYQMIIFTDGCRFHVPRFGTSYYSKADAEQAIDTVIDCPLDKLLEELEALHG